MRIGFGTSEFDPLIPGGAGTLVAQLVRRLRQRGDDVRVVIGTDDHPAASDDFVTVVDPVVAPGWDLPFMDRSMAVAEGLSRLHSDDPFDLVEIQDFDGLAFWTLSHRRDLGFGSTPLLVRFHGPVDLQIEAMGTTSHELDTVAAMERESFRMADGVIVPSVGVGELVADRYGIDSDRIVLGAPAVRSLTHRSSWRGGGAELLVIGRLSEVKGSHDMVRASVPVLESHPDLVVTFAGADGWSLSRHEPMRTFLDSMIPAEVADRIRFLGHVAAPDLAKKVESCVAVVVPSRFESFNLAVHEARIVGAPVIVPDIPAFEGLLDATTGAEVYDGTVEGLTAALEHVVSDPGFARDLATRPIPGIGEPTDVYVSDVVDVRHVRSQGGLGTAALARVEAVWFDDARVEPRSSLSKTVLSRTPAGLVRVLKPLVPRRLRTRLRTDADWDRIVADRVFEERWTDAVRRLTAEPPPAHPRTVFVIPCFNQGRWVRDAVLSVTDQTDSDWGVVIVDDGSTDPDTREVLDSIAMPGVEVIRQDNTGLPAARNAGIRATTSEYVVPLDADDTIDPTFLERLRVALEHDPDAGYAHCWARLYGDLDAVWATRPPNPYQLMISNAVVGCVVLRRDIWANAGGYDESMQSGNEDWDLWIRIGADGHHGTQVRAPLFWYRKHGVSMSVETESEYESTLADLTARLPELYRPSHLIEVKRRWYPLVTVLGPVIDERVLGACGNDVQSILVDDGDVTPRLRTARGKYSLYVVDPSGLEAGCVERMCSILERRPDLGSVTTSAPTPLRVVRTWSIFDPAAPSDDLVIDDPASSAERLEPHMAPWDQWIVDETIDGVAVQRQHPEESGYVPRWARAR